MIEYLVVHQVQVVRGVGSFFLSVGTPMATTSGHIIPRNRKIACKKLTGWGGPMPTNRVPQSLCLDVQKTLWSVGAGAQGAGID